MTISEKLKLFLTSLRATAGRLEAKSRYRLAFYRGVISPESIDTGKRDILGQALEQAPGQIHCIAEIHLDMGEGMSPTNSFDASIQHEIRPMIHIIRQYLAYILRRFTIKPQKEGHHG